MPKHFKPENITVKIDNNTKRATYVYSSPRVSHEKRHTSIKRYDSSADEQELSEYVRRGARTPPSPRVSRFSEIDEFDRSRDLDRSYHTYKVLCVSALHPKATDEQVKETLYREYRKFGEFSVKISHELDERMAYVCFKNSGDAKDAIQSKPKISLFDKIALVAPVYESRSSRDHYESRARRSQSRHFSPDVERYYPAPIEVHRPHLSDRLYERLPYGVFPSMRPQQIFRQINMPSLNPRELMISRQQLLHRMPPTRPFHPLHGHVIPRHVVRPLKPYSYPRMIQDKKDKFPNYLHHILPEDDPLATRTLFAGNLELSISDEELYHLFSKYGVVEDIDVKRPLPGTGNSYAFVRYQNLDMAHRAKVELSGQYIGRYQCKIGYGKSIPTLRIWVGGLGPWTALSQLIQEFDRFGAIKKIEFTKGDTCAYIHYESIDAATAAVNGMRGVPLGGSEHKLRTDFATEVCSSPTLTYSTKSKSSQGDVPATARDLQELTRQFGWPDNEYPLYSSRIDRNDHTEYSEESRGLGNHENSLSFKQHSVSDISSSGSSLHQFIDSDVESEEAEIQSVSPLDSVRTLEHLACKCSDSWQGSLVLKTSQFPAKCHLISGDANIIQSMMKDLDGKSILRITQRLRLDESKLEDVSNRITTADKHAIFLAMPYSTHSIYNDDALIQIRPLRNLVTYLKQKEAAGVISLINKDPELIGVLYAFPPCEYSAKLLKQFAKNLSSEALNDDHLVVVVVNGDL
ncbi:putative RNA-binding protein 15 [Myzus persicae]|uniref:putative RNA-binding protein 15 n=1 Tax=Myzus persicae TaxID=13164 RepID=UPI000B936B85|nr:putative RNA-binding protein 15 [Myzus persicae]